MIGNTAFHIAVEVKDRAGNVLFTKGDQLGPNLRLPPIPRKGDLVTFEVGNGPTTVDTEIKDVHTQYNIDSNMNFMVLFTIRAQEV